MRALAPLVQPAVLLGLTLCLTACARGGEGEANLPGGRDTQPFSAISATERIHFVGTEPFWGGHVEGTRALYTTPEQPGGVAIPVERFAGRGGLSFSGTIEGRAFDLAATPGDCSDGMSDRTYPLTVTLTIGEELRQGCGWTDRQPYAELPPG